MFAGFMTAVLHAFSAIALIGGLYLITSKAVSSRFNNITPVIEKASYSIIVILGMYLLFSHLHHQRKNQPGGTNNKHNPDTIMFIIASGLIPCPGAAAIMIFSIAVSAPLTGIYAVIAMSLGMAVVLSIIPPAAILINTKVEPILARWNPKTGSIIHSVISVSGAVMMIIFGLLFLM
jgi:ABC-type nickel/cobalt efflux system permease component RcnA